MAQAQSTVTLSGTIDIGLEKTASGQALQLQDSRNGTTQITVAGVEDLGGGLKARFQVSTAFDSSFDNAATTDGVGRSGSSATVVNATGTTLYNNKFNASKFGNNGMFLALDGGFGSLVLGRPVNTLYGFSYTANGTKGVTGYAATSSITNSGVYSANAIQYLTPNLGGFSAQLEYAPSEQVGVKSTTSVGLKYANSRLGASLVIDNAKPTTVRNATTGAVIVAAGTQSYSKITQLAGFYDFDIAKVYATYQKNSSSAASYVNNADSAYVLGVNVPLGAGLIWAQYGVAAATGTDARIFGAGYKYNLSKRTTAYFNFGNRNTATGVGYLNTTAQTKGTGYGFGLQHNF